MEQLVKRKERHILSPRCRFHLGLKCTGMLLMAPNVHSRYALMKTRLYYDKKRLYFEEIVPGSGGKGTGEFCSSAPVKEIVDIAICSR